ncbi:MAG TPA: BatA domain-containing protein [Gemmatimonadales bacterium]
MLRFLSPTWLFGLAALAVPLALHLWSRRTGRPIRVGSIHLLAGAPPATARSWRIQEPWILLLRCAVLAALVAALAGPYWAPRDAAGPTWALVADDVADRSALTDSLERLGLVVRPLDSANLWMALRETDREAPPGTRFLVFGPAILRDFHGARPLIGSTVEWHSRPAMDAGARAAIQRTGARVVALYADPGRREDARYVSAALRAAGLATGIRAIVTFRSTDGTGESAADADWAVWLSDRSIPEAIRRRVREGTTLVSDAGNAPTARRRTRIVLADQPSDAWLERRGVTADDGAPVWSDGAGAPLLTAAREGRGVHYRFHSRFAPAWGDFVLRPAFPEAMARLWVGADPVGKRSDDRRIAHSQLLPVSDRTLHSAASVGHQRSLFLPAWLVAVLLFVFERRLAGRARTRLR